ncbi:hypothetical protein ACH4GM_16035 [Streptomyces coeruleorubidus]|uniref:hypothetical protein n=1 Tax=Streptomyces coeruleorubidus TaxID=116188 RepID=UPI00379A80DC
MIDQLGVGLRNGVHAVSKEDLSNVDIDRQFATIVRREMKNMAEDVERGDLVDRVLQGASESERYPTWYLVPLRLLCVITYFMTLWLCVAAYGGVMNGARWGTATLISLCVSLGSGIFRRVAQVRYDRRNR